MIDAVKCGALSLAKLEAMTTVCSVGLDMIAVPGDTSAATLTGMIADELAIGMVNQKTTAVRVIPVPGKGPGDTVEWGGLLGTAIVQDPGAYSWTWNGRGSDGQLQSSGVYLYEVRYGQERVSAKMLMLK